jgi:1-acyl-sn-glycerol-3-phosphate acyltransferase
LRRLPARLYAFYAWMLFVLIAPWVWLGVMLVPRSEMRWAFVRGGVRLLRRLACVRLAVSGREHIPPPGQSFVLASNHQSYLDAMAVLEAVDRPIAFVAKRELAANSLVRLLLTRLGTLFVERFDMHRSAAEAPVFAATLERGMILGFFPEGTFREQPGLLPFRMGAFLAAAEGEVPLLPIALRGTRELMPGSTFFPRPGRATVIIGSPLGAMGNTWEAAVRLRDQAREFILANAGDPTSGPVDSVRMRSSDVRSQQSRQN